MELLSLIQRPRHLDQVADWLYSEWGMKTQGNLEAVRKRLESFKRVNEIPINYIALNNDCLVGTFNIMPSDPPARQDLSPWLGSLYVDPRYRNQGIGSFLAKSAVLMAKQLGFKKLYLCTPSRQGMYKELGWRPIDLVLFRQEPVTIMETLT